MLHHTVEHVDQRIEEPIGVHNHNRTLKDAELMPGHHLAQLVKSADPSGQSDCRTCITSHCLLARMHRRRVDTLCETGMRPPSLKHEVREHAGGGAASPYRTFDGLSHQSAVASTTDKGIT